MNKPRTEYDSPWKDILETYFEDFLKFFFPFVHVEIDWTQPIEFLNKELKQVTRDAEVGRRFADTLVKAYRLNGQESWLYAHVEIQSQSQPNLAERIFVYNNRISEQYGSVVESLVVLGDDDINWRPHHFSSRAIATTKEFDFPIVKLLDYKQRWSELEADRNPFATVVMVHLRTLSTQSNRRERKNSKLALSKRLYEQGFERRDIINLYRLIDWMMRLPIELELEFQQELSQYEEKMKMPYITSIEIQGELRGEQRGEIKGEQNMIIQLLNYRFGEINSTLVEQIRALTKEQLAELGKALFNFTVVTDVEQWLNDRQTST